MESRVDEIIHLPFPEHEGDSDYAPTLALWYLGAWTALYLAEIGGQSPEDSPVLPRAQAELSGEGHEG